MIAFTTISGTSTSLKAMLASSITTSNLQSTVWYHDALRQVRPDDAPYQTVPQYASLSTGSAEVSILDAPNSGTNRFVDGVAIYNADTVSATITVFSDDGTNRVHHKTTLQTGETLHWEPGQGWYATDATGNRKVTIASATTFLWTPVFTFATAGDQNIVYSAQFGKGDLIGSKVHLEFNLITSTFTHTTASGNAQITGSPYTNGSASSVPKGTLSWSGITKANYTQIVPQLNGATATMNFRASGSGQAVATLTTADFPTGGTVVLSGSIDFFI